MMRRNLILMIGVTLAFSGCSGIPFFSSEEVSRNPVPQPDWEQADSPPDPKRGRDAKQEQKRTPSLVWLPENRVNINSVVKRGQTVTDTTGNLVSTGFGDCLSTGYSLLDGIECGALSEGTDEIASASDSQGVTIAELDGDLLGNRSVKQPAEDSVAAAEKVESVDAPVAEAPTDSPPAPIQPPRSVPRDSPEYIAASIEPARLISASYYRIVLTSDVFFHFARFELDGVSAAGQLALRGLLDRFARYDKTSLRKVIITGHSDNLGKQSANLAVSEQRAAAVKVFLIRAGIDADILETAGVGAASPIKHCVGKGKSASLKSCLAPNRRVEIEIIGAA